MRLTVGQAHVVVLFIGALCGLATYFWFLGPGYYKVLFFSVNQALFAKIVGYLAFGFYVRWCYEVPIEPNQQRIQTFFGAQTGEVWGEGNFLFVPRPFWGMWKSLSIEHFSFTIAAENRTKEGYRVMVFATGRAEPENVHLLAKMSPGDVREQVIGLSMSAVGSYIYNNARASLLKYQNFDISAYVQEEFKVKEFYGLKVKAFTTKVIEMNQETTLLFDRLAAEGQMEALFAKLKTYFPDANDAERYAMYATFVGLTPAVMSHVVHGNGKTVLLAGDR